jgi:DNA-binding transcriptional ArsR family regulator
LSRHLRVLRRSQLVEEESLDEDARVRVYRLRREPFDGLRSWVEDVQSFWEDQLASFKAHAERPRGRGSATAARKGRPR